MGSFEWPRGEAGGAFERQIWSVEPLEKGEEEGERLGQANNGALDQPHSARVLGSRGMPLPQNSHGS